MFGVKSDVNYSYLHELEEIKKSIRGVAVL